MKKWRVSILHDACTSVEVEAETEEEAKAKAMDEAESVCLCWSCSKKIEIGDPMEAVNAAEIDQ